MKKLIIIMIIALNLNSAYPQAFTYPIPTLIEAAKKMVLPIVCFDIINHDTLSSQGSCVMLGHNKMFAFLTCDHVISIKDSNNHFIKYYSNVFVNLNNEDGTTTLIKLYIQYADSIQDFALLTILDDVRNRNLIATKKIKYFYIQKSLWRNTNDLVEGDLTLYIGYPMLKNLETKNHPLSRVGYLSQKIAGNDYFLIDGFVQHGHSGSPVFLIREKGNIIPPEWDFFLIGIATAFPSEFSDIYEDVEFIRDPKRKALVNPGFTYVTSMNKIIPKLNILFNIIDK